MQAGLGGSAEGSTFSSTVRPTAQKMARDINRKVSITDFPPCQPQTNGPFSLAAVAMPKLSELLPGVSLVYSSGHFLQAPRHVSVAPQQPGC